MYFFSQICLRSKLLIIGVIDAGIGEKQVNSLLSALNIPLISPATIKRRQRELVPHLGKMTEENCRKSFITCWLRNMFSLVYTFNTGYATLIGQSTKKCIAYAVNSKRCRICQNAETKSVPARKHTCSHNWSASPKSMEPAVAFEMLQGLMDEAKQVNIQLMWHGWSYYIHKIHTKQDKNCE